MTADPPTADLPVADRYEFRPLVPPTTVETAKRDVVVVDVETTGLDERRHAVVEVAWHNLMTDECGWFVPPHDWREVVVNADLAALKLNGYFDRIVQHASPYGEQLDVVHDSMRRFAEVTHGATIAGSNPDFDRRMLRALWDTHDSDVVLELGWHHRPLDLGAYAAGALGLPFGDPPGLKRVCALLGVKFDESLAHTAMYDVDRAVECLRFLHTRAGHAIVRREL